MPDLPEVGVYLYIYDGELCVRDDLQNDLQTCKVIAFEDYGVPLTEWVDTNSPEDYSSLD